MDTLAHLANLIQQFVLVELQKASGLFDGDPSGFAQGRSPAATSRTSVGAIVRTVRHIGIDGSSLIQGLQLGKHTAFEGHPGRVDLQLGLGPIACLQQIIVVYQI